MCIRRLCHFHRDDFYEVSLPKSRDVPKLERPPAHGFKNTARSGGVFKSVSLGHLHWKNGSQFSEPRGDMIGRTCRSISQICFNLLSLSER